MKKNIFLILSFLGLCVGVTSALTLNRVTTPTINTTISTLPTTTNTSETTTTSRPQPAPAEPTINDLLMQIKALQTQNKMLQDQIKGLIVRGKVVDYNQAQLKKNHDQLQKDFENHTHTITAYWSNGIISMPIGAGGKTWVMTSSNQKSTQDKSTSTPIY